MAKGGKRPGAGRPVGSTTKPQFRDYYTEEERLELVALVKKFSKEDPRILLAAIDHNFGRAAQSIDHTSGGEKLVQPLLDRAILQDNSTQKDTRNDEAS